MIGFIETRLYIILFVMKGRVNDFENVVLHRD